MPYYSFEIGEYRMLDNSFHQYPSILIYQIAGKKDGEYLVKEVAYMGIRNPYWGHDSADGEWCDGTNAIFSNSKDVDEKYVIQSLFMKKWGEFYVK